MLIKVKVFAGARKSGVLKKTKDSFEIRVRAKPEHGQANKEVVAAAAAYFGLSESGVKIIKGRRCPNKILKVDFY